MICLIAAVSFAVSGALAETGEVFPFPRSLQVPPSKRLGLGEEVPRVTSDRDFGIAISALGRSLRSVSRPGIAAGATQPLYELLDRAAAGRVIDPAEAPLDVSWVGFWQSRYQFSLSGRILAIRSTLLSTLDQEGDYRVLRGYWKAYPGARVFFADGVRMRFRIKKGLFASSYSTTSWLAPKNQVDPKGTDDTTARSKEDLVVEQFGVESPSLRFAGKYHEKKFDAALRRALGIGDDNFGRNFNPLPSTVEPVYIQLDPETARRYVAASLSAKP